MTATSARRPQGFTLVEVLATMLFMGIVLGVMTEGFTAATTTAGAARHRTEAAGLAASKLAELTATNQWTGVLAGDFGNDWPDYRWQATVTAWANDAQNAGLQQLDVTVSWTWRNVPRSVVVSGLVYTKPAASSS